MIWDANNAMPSSKVLRQQKDVPENHSDFPLVIHDTSAGVIPNIIFAEFHQCTIQIVCLFVCICLQKYSLGSKAQLSSAEWKPA